MTRVRRVGGLLVCVLLGALACAPAPSATPRADSVPAVAADALPPAAAPTAPPLRQVQVPLSSVSGSVAPVWVAAQAGLFERHGIAAEATAVSPAAATQAVIGGDTPLAITGASTVTAFVSGATELVFVGGGVNKAVFKVMGRPDVASVQELRGRRVGNTTASSSGTFALFETLRRFGLDPERDLTMVYLREQPAVLAGLLSDAVQGALLVTPLSEEAEAQGMRTLVDMRDLDILMLSANVTTTRGHLEREPDLVRRFLMAYVEAVQLARDQPRVAIEAIARGSGNPDLSQAEIAYRVYRPVWDIWPSEGAIQALLDSIEQPEARAVRPAAMINADLLRALEREGWLGAHYRPS